MRKQEVTRLLSRLKSGENEVYDKLYPLIYEELRQLAYRHMRNQYGEHTLSKTELVHEVYIKMVDQTQIDFTDKGHFIGIASRCMRQILIDYARKKNAEKRGGKQEALTYIDELFCDGTQKVKELLDIDSALNELETLNERLAKVVEMRFFGNMTIEDTAKALSVSRSTVKRDWMKARGWLYKELKGRYQIN